MSVRSAVSAHGLSVTPPAGWEVSIFRRSAGAGDSTYPVMHAATVAIPSVRGDYGGGVVETLGAADVFVSLLEFGPDAVGKALFPVVEGIPELDPALFGPKRLQRVIRGQGGHQRFFTFSNRAFCLYTVLGSFPNRSILVAEANSLIATLNVTPA